MERLAQVKEVRAPKGWPSPGAGAGVPAWVDQLFHDLGGIEERAIPCSPISAFGETKAGTRITVHVEVDLSSAGPSPYRVLYGEPIPEDLVDLARSALPTGFELSVVSKSGEGSLVREVPDADFLIVATSRVNQASYGRASGCAWFRPRVLVTTTSTSLPAFVLWGAGGLDARGDVGRCGRTRNALALALLKKLRTLDNAVHTGSWPVWQYRSSSYELAGKTLGTSSGSAGSAAR